MIRVENMVAEYGDFRALDDISLEMEPDQTTVILGRSGSGKSTLLRCLIGLLKPVSGRVLIDGQDITLTSAQALTEIRKDFGVLFQSAALFNSLTVGENVAFPLREHTDLDEKTIVGKVLEKLDLVGLAGWEDHVPAELSGGMRKRAGLARALIMDPRMLFLDEPISGLDPIIAAGIDELVLQLRETFRNITIVVVTHELRSAFKIADRIVMLHEGRIVCVGTPADIRDNQDKHVQQFLRGEPDQDIGNLSRYYRSSVIL